MHVSFVSYVSLVLPRYTPKLDSIPLLIFPCGAVLRRDQPRGAVSCFASLCRAACCTKVIFRPCKLSFDDLSYSSTEVHRTRFVRTALSNRKGARSYSSAIAQQPCALRCAGRCRAMPCLSVLCLSSGTISKCVLTCVRSYV